MSEAPRPGWNSYGGIRIDEPEAAMFFYSLAEKFYCGNFGTAPKSEIDLMMFKFFDEASKSAFGRELSDFSVARKLGITPQMVRNRRTKLELREDGETGDWVSIFLDVLNRKTYVLRKAKSGCEMKIMLPSKMSVYEFEDILISSGHFFDNSFNNLVVVTQMSSVFDILFREIADVPLPPGCDRQTIVGNILFNLKRSKGLDPRIEKAAKTLWGEEVGSKVQEVGGKVLQGVATGAGRSLGGAIASPLFEAVGILDVPELASGIKDVASGLMQELGEFFGRRGVSEEKALADEVANCEAAACKIEEIAGKLEDVVGMSVEWETFSEDTRASFEQNGGI